MLFDLTQKLVFEVGGFYKKIFKLWHWLRVWRWLARNLILEAINVVIHFIQWQNVCSNGCPWYSEMQTKYWSLDLTRVFQLMYVQKKISGWQVRNKKKMERKK